MVSRILSLPPFTSLSVSQSVWVRIHINIILFYTVCYKDMSIIHTYKYIHLYMNISVCLLLWCFYTIAGVVGSFFLSLYLTHSLCLLFFFSRALLYSITQLFVVVVAVIIIISFVLVLVLVHISFLSLSRSLYPESHFIWGFSFVIGK